MVKAIVGANWGDEGKGKITDMLADEADIVIRFQGGANAGHTIVNNYGKFALHTLPSGVFHSHITNIIGNGVALDIPKVMSEIKSITDRNVPAPKIMISDRAQMVMPYHVLFDQYEEERLGKNSFGSTKSGIAPFYSDKYAKIGFQVSELFDEELLQAKVKRTCETKNIMLEHMYHKPLLKEEELLATLHEYRDMVAPYVGDVSLFLDKAIKEGKKILLEGQLGTLKDPDHGIYPMVTSSSTLAAYGAIGAGIPPYEIKKIVTVSKAYSSAVGAGAFVSEIFGDEADELRRRGGDGGEFRSQPRTAQRYDFIGVEFQCQSHFTGGGQQAAGLSDREHALLAKDIAKLCQPVLNNGGHDFTDNEIHVIVRASIVFLRHCMRAQKRRNDVHTLVLVIVQTAHHTELQQLGFLVQAVAALALDSGNSYSAHLLQEALCLGAQLDKVALTRSFHRTDNAAATLHNGHIALAFQPPGEFLGTFPAKHEVRMRIDKAGQKALAAGVVMPVALIIAVALLATVRAYVGDDASGNFHRSVIDDAKFFHFPAAAGGKADGSYDTGIEDYQIFCHSCFCFIFFRLLAQSVYSCTHSIIRASSTCCIEKFSSPR